MRLRSSFFSKIQDFKNYLDVFIGRSCAGTLDDDSLIDLFERVAVLYRHLLFTDVELFLKK